MSDLVLFTNKEPRFVDGCAGILMNVELIQKQNKDERAKLLADISAPRVKRVY